MVVHDEDLGMKDRKEAWEGSRDTWTDVLMTLVMTFIDTGSATRH